MIPSLDLKSVLDLISCPACRKGVPNLGVSGSTDTRSGKLECRNCSAKWEFEARLLHFWVQDESVASAGSAKADWIRHYTPLGENAPRKDPERGRDFSRTRVLIKPVRSAFSPSALVIDVGCGFNPVINRLVPQETFGYKLFGIDISLDALRAASESVPKGWFVHTPVEAWPFRAGIADVMTCLGLLMYLDRPYEALDTAIRIIKPGGILLLSEPIQRPRALSRFRLLRKMAGKEPSEKYRALVFQELIQFLEVRGKVIKCYPHFSPALTWFNTTFGAWFPTNKVVALLGGIMDQICVRTLGKLFRFLGAGEVMIVFRKSE